MPQNLSVAEIRAVAEAAITARHSADAAKKLWEDGAGSDAEATLKSAYDQAERTAAEAKQKADALSQPPSGDQDKEKRLGKLKRKKAIIEQQLRQLGQSDDIDDEDDDDEAGEDPNRPVTFGDLQRIERNKAKETALSMADAVGDPIAKQAIKDALARVVPSGDAAKDFADAVAIANRGKNSQVLQEIARRPTPPQHVSGAGAPARREEGEFAPTAEEAAYMKPPFNLSKEDILKARPTQ